MVPYIIRKKTRGIVDIDYERGWMNQIIHLPSLSLSFLVSAHESYLSLCSCYFFHFIAWYHNLLSTSRHHTEMATIRETRFRRSSLLFRIDGNNVHYSFGSKSLCIRVILKSSTSRVCVWETVSNIIRTYILSVKLYYIIIIVKFCNSYFMYRLYLILLSQLIFLL